MPPEASGNAPEGAGLSIPDAAVSELPPVDRWNQQGWPPITFGVPAAWTDVPQDRFAWLPEERRISPQAPILQQSHILAAVEHAGTGGRGWQVQLRWSDNSALAKFVIEDPVRWAGGRSLIGALVGEPEQLRVCDCPTVVLSYACRFDEAASIFTEAWLTHPDRAYHFVGSCPAEDEPRWRMAWETMLQNTQEMGGYPLAAHAPAALAAAPPAAVVAPAAAALRYRCGIDAQLPVTLENVTSSARGRTFIIGSTSLVAWAALGSAAMTVWGRARAAGLQGQIRMVPTSGEAALMDDRIILRVVVPVEVAGVRLRGDANSRSVNMEIPYRLVKQCGTDKAGVYLDVVGRGVLRLQPRDGGDFAQWLAHLSHNKTWQAPSPLELVAERQVVGWCQQDPRYTFGLPQQWVAANSGPLADYGRLFQPSVLRAGVLLDGGAWEAQVFVIENGPIQEFIPQPNPDSLAALLVAAIEIRSAGPVQIAAIGGETLALLRGTSETSDGTFDRCYGAFAHDGVLYALWYGVVGGTIGDGSYERWLPDFHSMLATWHWYV